MKNLLITTILLLQVTVFYGRNNMQVGQFEANAIDKNSGYALEYVAVTLLDANYNYVKGFISTVNGHFSLDGIAYGNYFLKLSKTGYEDVMVPLEISSGTTGLVGPLALSAQAPNYSKDKKECEKGITVAAK